MQRALSIPQLSDIEPILNLHCKVATKCYIESIQGRNLPQDAVKALKDIYHQVNDCCPHCVEIYRKYIYTEMSNNNYSNVGDSAIQFELTRLQKNQANRSQNMTIDLLSDDDNIQSTEVQNLKNELKITLLALAKAEGNTLQNLPQLDQIKTFEQSLAQKDIQLKTQHANFAKEIDILQKQLLSQTASQSLENECQILQKQLQEVQQQSSKQQQKYQDDIQTQNQQLTLKSEEVQKLSFQVQQLTKTKQVSVKQIEIDNQRIFELEAQISGNYTKEQQVELNQTQSQSKIQKLEQDLLKVQNGCQSLRTQAENFSKQAKVAQKELDSKNEKVIDLEKEISEKTQILLKIKQENQEKTELLQNSQQAVEVLQRQNNQLHREMDIVKEQLVDLQELNTKTNRDIDAQQQNFQQTIKQKSDDQVKIAELQREISQVQIQMNELLESKVSEVEQTKKQAESELKQLNMHISTLKSTIQQNQIDIDLLKDQQDNTEKQLKAQNLQTQSQTTDEILQFKNKIEELQQNNIQLESKLQYSQEQIASVKVQPQVDNNSNELMSLKLQNDELRNEKIELIEQIEQLQAAIDVLG
ncbi:hypothetical protein SS50377_25046 [Spironucleus salmonicida]|uniref:Uncharacterized protein n=1 Tax=Spironucleus salmonicida TaxID=348837 RepID=V6LQR8_9EUKA|nr:hypothetical protein SS50377_25046 [Spironucleus salmonicida]|eukprot:EST43099.1 Hypothetical protein SS50377_17256 [Spironucleus salmonicida]